MVPPLAVAACLLASASPPLVHRVRIDADDETRRSLERYVEIAPGQPLDPERVRRTVELMHATGAYADIRVETEATTAGIDVIVRPIAGPLMRDVRIGGESPVDAGDIRKVTRLRTREPLWPHRLEGAAKSVAQHLADEGYVAAQVTAEAVPERGDADAVFHVRAGVRARVARVRIEGDRAPPELLALARPRVGEVWRAARARTASDEMHERLARQGYWRATVRPVESYDAVTAAVTLVFQVDRGPRLEAVIDHAAVPAGVRTDVQRLLRDNSGASDAIDEAVDRLEEALRLAGRRDARVTTREEPSPESTRVVFDVDPGPLTTVASVRVTGDVEAPPVTLLTRPGEPLRDRTLDEDVRTLARALEADGHPDARIDVEAADRVGAVPVVFRLRAGPRTEIAAVDVTSPVTLGGKNTARELRCRPGGPYRVGDLVRDRNALVAVYHNAGYLQASVTSALDFSEDRSRVAIRFDVDPGPRTFVDHVVIAGLTHTREEIVRRELQLGEGDPLGLEAVLDSQRRLGSLGVLGSVSISEIDPESVARRSLLVSVEELPLTRVAYGVGYSEREGPRLSTEVTRRNLGGRDRSVTTFVRGSFRGLRFFTTYREPYLLGKRQELFVTGFREEEERDTFDYIRYGLILEAARRLSPSWSLITRFATQETRSFDLKVAVEEIDRLYLNAVFSGPSLSLIHDSRDDPLDPRHGLFVAADTQLSHRVLGGDSFLKGFAQASLYRRLGTRLVVAANGRFGLARTLESNGPDRLPFPDRFFAGGDYSLRGFEQDRVGPLEPSSPDTDVPTGGNALVLAGTELRLNVGRYFGVAAFGDAGQVYALISDIDLGDVRYSAGVGLRYKSAFGPIRVDWGYKLNRRDDKSASRFHFTIGHAF